MRERKLRSVLNWQGVLKQKGVKQTGVKQGPGVLTATVGSLLMKFCPTQTDFLADPRTTTEDYTALFTVVGRQGRAQTNLSTDFSKTETEHSTLLSFILRYRKTNRGTNFLSILPVGQNRFTVSTSNIILTFRSGAPSPEPNRRDHCQ
jgi:hypothetical protein